MTEQELLEKIQDLCDQLGLLYHHCRDSRHCAGDRGFPDLFILGTDGHVFWEVKSRHGETTSAQDQWAYRFDQNELGFCVVTPDDWESGDIRKALLMLK